MSQDQIEEMLKAKVSPDQAMWMDKKHSMSADGILLDRNK